MPALGDAAGENTRSLLRPLVPRLSTLVGDWSPVSSSLTCSTAVNFTHGLKDLVVFFFTTWSHTQARRRRFTCTILKQFNDFPDVSHNVAPTKSNVTVTTGTLTMLYLVEQRLAWYAVNG